MLNFRTLNLFSQSHFWQKTTHTFTHDSHFLELVSHLLLDLLLLTDLLHVPVFPVALPHLDGPAAHVLAVDLSHGPRKVHGVPERDEPVALGLVVLFVADDLGLLEGRILAERALEDLVSHVVAEVAAKDPEKVVKLEIISESDGS